MPGKSAKRVFAQNDPAIHRFSEKNAPVEPGHDEGMKFKRSANAPGAAAAMTFCQRPVDQPHLLAGSARSLVSGVIRHQREIQLGI